MTSRWMTVAEVAEAISFCPTTVYQLLKTPDFPKPFRPSGNPRGHPRWWSHQIEAWRQRFAPADGQAQEAPQA